MPSKYSNKLCLELLSEIGERCFILTYVQQGTTINLVKCPIYTI